MLPRALNYNEGKYVNAVAQSYVRDSHDNVQFTYGNSQTSSVTIGYSTTNAFGSFSADGTHQATTTGTETYPYEIGAANTYWRTGWEWEILRQECQPPIRYYYFSQPYAWEPNDNEYHPSSDGSYQHCWEQYAGSKPDMGNTTATTINVAFDNTMTGFSGSSRIGYNSSADLTFYYGEHGYLCGNNPPASFGYPVAIP